MKSHKKRYVLYLAYFEGRDIMVKAFEEVTENRKRNEEGVEARKREFEEKSPRKLADLR